MCRTSSSAVVSAVSTVVTRRPSLSTVIRPDRSKTSASRCETYSSADAPLLQPAYQPVEQLDLVVGQGRGRLVHDEQPRVEGERLDDLDDLLLRDAELAHPGVGAATCVSPIEASSRRGAARASPRRSTSPRRTGSWPR